MKKAAKAMFIGLSLSLLASCGVNEVISSTGSATSTLFEESKTHSVKLIYVDNKGIPNCQITIKSLANEVIAQGKTTEEGIFSFDAPMHEYAIEVTGMPKGYYFEESPKFLADQSEITINATSRVMDEEMDEGTKYALNDIMYDFSWTDCDNITHSLKETLEEKELVIINFWFTNCSNCVNEYPYMINAYEAYKDDIEIFGLTYETNAQSKSAKKTFGCTWPMGYDEAGMIGAFGVSGYPTTVFVDRYGRVDFVESGSMIGDVTWSRRIEKYLGEDYVPEPFVDTRVHPNVEMPSSSELEAAACGNGFSTTFTPETNEQDAEWSWPFVVSEDGNSIQPSNQYVDNSFSIVYFDVALNMDECFAFDYLSSTEDVDILYVLVNGEIQVEISGVETEWKTSYAYVASESATYHFGLVYMKDEGDYLGDDTVYINNMRVIGVEEIEEPTYVLRHAASGNYSQFTHKYSHYITPVYNEEDEYFHVDKVDGPLLMANFLTSSQLTEYSLYDFAVNGAFANIDGVDYTQKVTEYATAANATKVGYIPVTLEMKELLVTIVTSMTEVHFPEQWLHVCDYFNAYGTGGVEMEDPSIGITFDNAMEAKLGNQNYATFDHVIMPRGLVFYFEAPEEGVYQFNSIGELETECWIYDSAMSPLCKSEDIVTRDRVISENQAHNFIQWVDMQEGEKIYIVVAFYDIYEFSTLRFNIEFMGANHTIFQSCSPGFFTTNLDDEGNMTDIIRLGIDVKIGDDGYYHELKEDGTLGSIVYLDVTEPTQLFSLSIQRMAKINDPYINIPFFDCRYDEDGNEVPGGKDYTEAINQYIKTKVIIEDGETFGCIAVDQGLGVIMQAFMDKYSYPVKENWLKLCYYFLTIGD